MYTHLTNDKESTDDEEWMMVLRLNMSERVRSFMWLVKHGRLLTNFSKNMKGMGYATYSICGSSCESILHALCDCPSVRKLWKNIVPAGFFHE